MTQVEYIEGSVSEESTKNYNWSLKDIATVSTSSSGCVEMETKINPRLFMTMKKKKTHKMPGKQGVRGWGGGGG